MSSEVLDSLQLRGESATNSLKFEYDRGVCEYLSGGYSPWLEIGILI